MPSVYSFWNLKVPGKRNFPETEVPQVYFTEILPIRPLHRVGRFPAMGRKRLKFLFRCGPESFQCPGLGSVQTFLNRHFLDLFRNVHQNWKVIIVKRSPFQGLREVLKIFSSCSINLWNSSLDWLKTLDPLSCLLLTESSLANNASTRSAGVFPIDSQGK